MPSLRRMYQHGITLPDVLLLIEYGIQIGSITAEMAILWTGYTLAVQAGLSPTSAVVLEATAATAYHHRASVFQFFSTQWRRLKDACAPDEEDTHRSITDLHIS